MSILCTVRFSTRKIKRKKKLLKQVEPHAPKFEGIHDESLTYAMLQMPSMLASPHSTYQNPKLSNKLFVSGSSNTFCGGTFKPRGWFGDLGLGRSSTTRLLLRRSIFRRSGTLALWECSRGSSWGWTRNSQLRTKFKVS